jgi:hypothetical protein
MHSLRDLNRAFRAHGGIRICVQNDSGQQSLRQVGKRESVTVLCGRPGSGNKRVNVVCGETRLV